MRIVVLLSTYNGETYLEQQIASILAQDCDGQVDLCIRDDGSTDRTQEILAEYAAKGILQWYTGNNLKPAKSFLDLVAHCPGYDYYAFCDQDDYWYPDKLRSGIARMKDQTGPAMSFANARLVDGDLQPLGRNVYCRAPHHDFYSVLCGGGILGCTVMFNNATAHLLQTYHSPEKLIMHDSYSAILCTLFGGKITYDPTAHMDYRQHGNNVVGTNWTKLDALRDRWDRITKKPQNNIAEMAQSILDQNPQGADPEKLAFLQKVATYRHSCFSALALACSRKPTYNSKSMALTMRLAILLRNR